MYSTLNNVARRAEASRVELTLHTSDTHCLPRIVDNGYGVSREAVEGTGPHTPFGLIGVRERAHMPGGSIRSDTAQSAGFAISMTFPLQSMQQEDIDP
ncbi:hypothetical protein [Paraburkholderia sp. Cpub6]|uniref:ATP-binding protein n=1 Tax=Paraburkholderia sp. Cpub6 TaxID=2723094 RepID=UPI00160F4857|nr:hypothetical protein [Paraburkholderia sp. Cpub6]MBB5461072.1 signal transduction histidine kinase [Paraburkholderia sp. Cpub6]